MNNAKEEILAYFKTKLNNVTNNKQQQKEEQWSLEEEKKYESWVYGLSLSSFVLGLGIAVLINKRKGAALTSKIEKKLIKPRLQQQFSHDPMNDAKKFAIKTFGLGTLLCAGVFTISGATVSYLTGTTNLKDFSHFMREKIGGQLLSNPVNADEEDSRLDEEIEIEKNKDEDLKEFLNCDSNEEKMS